MALQTNAKAFLAASRAAGEDFLRAYLGLVAIELALKGSIQMSDHNVPDALGRFANRFAVGPKRGCKVRLDVLARQLKNDLTQITVQSKGNAPMLVPAASYPNLRYTRLQCDGWPSPCATPQQLTTLVQTVSAIHEYLSTKFGLL